MLVLGEKWCFCNGGGKSERMKGNIFNSKGSAMATICNGKSSGFLIHRNLLLTTHVNLPSVTVAEAAEIRLQDNVPARLVPHRFFITSTVLDLTIVGLDAIEGDSNAQNQHPHYLKTSSSPTLDLGSVVYLLGHNEKKQLVVCEGKVVIATDNLIKFSTDGETWSPGSAGFDAQGNLAFMVCDPMKLASSPSAKATSTSSSSSSSWNKDQNLQFGIPIPIIFDWLNQHWEGSLDDLSKPKLPLIRLMSTGQKSESSCASFTLRRVFKSTEGETDGLPSFLSNISNPMTQHGPNCSVSLICQDETPATDLHSSTHEQGIPTPEIYDSPRLTAVRLRNKENTHIQLLDINFPPRAPKPIVLPLPIKRWPPTSAENVIDELAPHNALQVEDPLVDRPASSGSNAEIVSTGSNAEIVSTGSVNGDCSEVQSSSSPVGPPRYQNEADGCYADYSSEVETMYSAETMESRNYTSPREQKFQQVGRSQSCVSYNRWGVSHRTMAARKGNLQKQQTFIQARKTCSQGAASQKSHDYYSPTVSSIMKKRNNSEQMNKPRQSPVRLSPKWH
ncbi:hypothetical protein AQUCO_03400009v1 [Aquilegia coerulea]|uniref:Peptidase S1 domain-containing protein n=1 Tax=Aquilegia coerulea TaxID=218851 RepID=A0A2G5CY24_AQUCA|nr:hypothetical protein AQUCO_03400009v1 [Aquilegia coerulea]